jgi:carbon monoxide dehydrogenase subunit G
VPTTRRSRVVAAPQGVVWGTVGNPTQLPRWWPKVVRVEGADDRGFTEVLATDRGRSVRADFVVLEHSTGQLLSWSQEVEGTPFERILRSAETAVRLEPAGEASTRVTLEQRQRLRGPAALGGLLVRRATRRILDQALDALEEVHGRAR